MSPVVNPMLPIGNAPASLLASLPVQALTAAKPFELTIPAIALPTPTPPAPTQIAPGKMLNVEGSTPADTAIPADVIPANAIELIEVSCMREDVQPEIEQSPTPLVATPRWEFKRYLPADPVPVSRVIKLPLAEPENDQVEPEGKTTPKVEILLNIVAPVETPVGVPINSTPDTDVQTELKAAKEPAIPITDINVPQIAPVIVAPVPANSSAPVAPSAKAAIAPSVSTPVSRRLPAKPSTLPEADVAPSPDAIPAKAGKNPELPIQRVILDAKGQQATPALASKQAETVVTNPAAQQSLPVWTRPTSPKAAKAETYAFVNISRKAEIETPVSVVRPLKETIIDSGEPIAGDSDIQAVTAPSAPLMPVDARASDAFLGQIDAVKTANPLAELSGAGHVAQRHLDLARDTQWLDGLARDIVAASDRSGSMSFRLSPANLGQLDVELSNSDAGLSVMMTTNSKEATQIVTSAQPALIDTLQSQGVRVADTQVMNQPTDMSRQGQQQRQTPANFIETGFTGSNEPDTQDRKQPRGRFA